MWGCERECIQRVRKPKQNTGEAGREVKKYGKAFSANKQVRNFCGNRPGEVYQLKCRQQ